MACGCKKNKNANTRYQVSFPNGTTRVFSNENSANKAVQQNPGAKKVKVTAGQ